MKRMHIRPFGPSVSAAARYLGISPPVLYKWVREGDIPPEALRRRGKRTTYISWEWLEELSRRVQELREGLERRATQAQRIEEGSAEA